MKEMLSSFITEALIQAPNPAPVAPPGAASLGTDIISWFKWVALIAGVAGLIACGIMMMIGRRNRSSMAADGASGIPWAVGGLMVVSLASVVVSAII
jgi:drug/metabolite transporter (DMT)-like permease